MLTAMMYSEDERRKIGEAVRRKRVAEGLDKEPAARKADVSSITWKRVEDGEGVRDASLTKILSTLGLPPADDLLAERAELAEALAKVIPTGPATPPTDRIDAMDVGDGSAAGIVGEAQVAWTRLVELADLHGDPDATFRAVIGSSDFYIDALLTMQAGPAAKPLLRDIFNKVDEVIHIANERNAHAVEAKAKSAAQGKASEDEKSKLLNKPEPKRLDPDTELIIASAADVDEGDDGRQERR